MGFLILDNLTKQQKEVAIEVFAFSCAQLGCKEWSYKDDLKSRMIEFRIEPPIEEDK